MTASYFQTARRVTVFALAALIGFWIIQVGVSGLMLEKNPRGALSMWPGSAAAASQVAENLVREGKIDEGQALAVQALSISAQDSQALHTLADVGRAKGNAGITDTALNIAAHLGWRDVFVQSWVLENALKAGDASATAQSADALVRSGFDPARSFAAFRTLLATPEGRVALAERLSAKPGWSELFLARYYPKTAQEGRDFGQLLVELDRQGARPDDKHVQPYFEVVIKRGEYQTAFDVWSRMNPRASGDPSTGLIDGSFAEFAADASPWGPFGWRMPAAPNTTITTAQRSDFGNDPMIEVSSEAQQREQPLTQLLALRPGRYELSYDALLNSGARSAFKWMVVCYGQNVSLAEAPAVPQGGQRWGSYRIAFTVPAANCQGQVVALVAGPVLRGTASASFDSMQIRPAL